MKGIKLSLLGITVILAGLSFATNHIAAMAAGALGCCLSIAAFFVAD